MLDVQEDRAVHEDHKVDDPVEGGAGVLLAHDGPAAAVLAGLPTGGADLPYGHAGPLLADLAGAEPLQQLYELLVVLVQLGEDVGGEGLDQVEELGVVEPHKVDDLPGVHSPEGEEGADGTREDVGAGCYTVIEEEHLLKDLIGVVVDAD